VQAPLAALERLDHKEIWDRLVLSEEQGSLVPLERLVLLVPPTVKQELPEKKVTPERLVFKVSRVYKEPKVPQAVPAARVLRVSQAQPERLASPVPKVILSLVRPVKLVRPAQQTALPDRLARQVKPA
jgi:hypothetical protein